MYKKFFLNHQCSPEQIFVRLKMEDFKYTIINNTIYRSLSYEKRDTICKIRYRGKSYHTKNYEEKRGKIII